MSWMRRVTEYLGLAPDEEYDEVDDYDERDERFGGPSRSVGRQPLPSGRPATVVHPEPERNASVRALPVQPVRPSAMLADDDDDRDRVVARPQSGPVVVRPQPVERPIARPQVVSPSSFSAAQDVADKFKANRPVIMNLQGLDRDLRRRLIDFASGLCYGLGGQMDKVADHVFLLTPADVEVTEEEKRRLSEHRFDER
jgi:cell division inhibitor SepF